MTDSTTFIRPSNLVQSDSSFFNGDVSNRDAHINRLIEDLRSLRQHTINIVKCASDSDKRH